jgi:hypothetical protein
MDWRNVSPHGLFACIHIMPDPSAIARTTNIIVTSACTVFNVIFLSNEFPIKVPIRADPVAAVTSRRFSCNPDVENLVI